LAIHQPRRAEDSEHSAELKFIDLYMSERGKIKSQRLAPDYPIFRDKAPKLIRHYDEEIGKTVKPLRQIEGTEQAVPQSLILVPLIFRGDSFGVLSVQHISPNVYDEEDLQLLELIGTQIAQALANRRMYQYFDDLDKTGQKLTQQLESEVLLREVVERIREASDADVVVLYPYDKNKPENNRFIMPPYSAGKFLQPEYPKPQIKKDDIAWLVLNSEEPVFKRNSAELYEALGGDWANRKGNFEEREQIKSTAALALKIGDETVGILFVNYRVRQRFDAPQKALIVGLASYAAIAIRNSRLIGRRDFLERLREIDRAISQSLDLKTVLYSILDEGSKVLPADEAAIMLYDKKNDILQVEAARGNKSDDRLKRGIPFNDKGKGITRWVYENKETVNVGDVRTNDKFKRIYNSFSADTISELDAPLLDGDQAVGVINYESNTENAYSQMHEDFITSLATQAVVAVKNAKLYQQQAQKAFELSVFSQIEHKIVDHLDLQEFMNLMLDNALKLTNSESGSVLLYDSRRESLVSKVDRGFDPQYADIALTEGQGIVWEAFRKGEILNIDVNALEWKEKFVEAIPNARWELAVPIPDGDKFRGVINIERIEGERFTDNDERLVSQLASLASIALHNAEQYEKTKKLSDLLEALHDVDLKIIAQEGNVNGVVRQVLESAGALTLAEFVGLHFFNEEGLPSRRYVRRREDRKRGGVTWKAHLSKEPQTTGKIGIITHVRQSGKPYFTKGNAQDDKYYRSSPDLLNTKSEAAVPLVLEDRVIGVLNLESSEEFAFDEDHLYVLKLLADQAVIALQNARNFTKAKVEARRFQLLLEVGRELGNISDLDQKDQALQIVFDKITAHHEGQIIYRRYDQEREVFVLEKFERLPDMAPQDLKRSVGINGQVARDRRAILVRDVDNPGEGIAKPHTPATVKSVIVAPVIFEDRYYGNLTLRHEQVSFYEQQDLELLDGFARQLAITLRRLEVVETQQEAEVRARHSEMFQDLGQSAYELTHRLSNDLGLVSTSINEIRDFLAKREISSTTVDAELDKIFNDVSRVLNMSNGLKTKVAKSEEARAVTDPAVEVLVKSILEEAKWSPTIPANITLSWKEVAEPFKVKVVAGQVIEILYTLISNAIEAMPKGGKISVKAYKLDRDVCIEVSDNGPGISKANQKKVFNLFFSTKNSSGFGLWSARRYARANGGELSLKSMLGKGTSFILSLPLLGAGK
jgi:GAF domain-containing protein